MILNFNPRPREEGDFAVCFIENWEILISIHALAKRATRTENRDGVCRIISIHALAKRATNYGVVGFADHSAISIHALAKRATCCYPVDRPAIAISIHALAKRAT